MTSSPNTKHSVHQFDLFGDASPTAKTAPDAPGKTPKKVFTPPSLQSGLNPHYVRDHAMLWMRMMTKGARQTPEMFIYHQIQEMRFKRTEHDPVLSVRQSLVKAFVRA